MKAKLILKRYNDCYALNDYGEPSKGYPLVIAHSDDENFRYKLSKQNCDQIFGVVNVEKLADSIFEKESSNMLHPQHQMRNTFILGFNKAMELNKDKVFTEEDVRKAYIYGVSNCHSFGHSAIDYTDKCIQSLQQPTEIEVEIEMEKTRVKMPGIMVFTKSPKLDSEGCLILKKI